MAPTTGARVLLERPYVHAETFHLLVDTFAPTFPDRLKILLRDHRGAPTAQHLRWLAPVRGVWWPPDGPERNPVARVLWRALKEKLAWVRFTGLEAQPLYGGGLLHTDRAPTLQTRTADPSLVEAIHALGS